MTLRAGSIKQPKKHPHVCAAKAALAALGATDVSVSQKKHIRIAWRLAGQPMSISLGIHASDVDGSMRLATKRVLQRAHLSGFVTA